MNEVVVERPAPHVAVIRMNRPEARNALNQAVRSGLMLERKAFQLLFASRDQKEGMHAFLDKREPQFTGK